MKKQLFYFLVSISLSCKAQVGNQPAASIHDAAWLQGNWRCENDWGISEESWTEPIGGSMAALYRLSSKDKPVFFEFITLSELNGSLVLRLKHFSSDMKAWEEKTETIDFPLMQVSKDELVFDGSAYKKKMTIKNISKGAMQIVLDSEDKEGKKSSTIFSFKREHCG